jgi:hypothetical protein
VPTYADTSVPVDTGLRCFPRQPLSGSACRASDQPPRASAGHSLAPTPSAAPPDRVLARRTPLANPATTGQPDLNLTQLADNLLRTVTRPRQILPPQIPSYYRALTMDNSRKDHRRVFTHTSGRQPFDTAGYLEFYLNSEDWRQIRIWGR